MPTEKIYHKLISHLVDMVSYGTLGVIDTFANNPEKYDVVFINITTILRNCYVKDATVQDILRLANQDLEQLVSYIRRFSSDEVKIVLYMDVGLRDRIPKGQKRELTTPRDMVEKSAKAFKEYHNAPGRLSSIGENIFLFNSKGFAHHELSRVKSRVDKVGKACLISHCPLDYLLITKEPSIDIIQSHTGNILQLIEISKKVFKNEGVPFNATSLAVFGDKDHIKPQFRSNKKVIEKEGSKLKRMSSFELKRIMRNKYDIEASSMSWL